MRRRDFVASLSGAGAFAALAPVPRWRLPPAQTDGLVPPSEAFLRDLPELLTLASVPGLSAALVRGRETVWAIGIGTSGVESPTEVTPETPFEAASLTKPVVAYLAMLLVQDGRLDLDRPLDAYLPSPYLSDDARAGSITVRRVLSHTTGYRNWRFNRDQRLVTEFAPGERFQYSGEGFYQLQVVIETVVGRGLAALARERVLDRFGMNDSSLVWRAGYAGTIARPHRSRGQAAEHRTAQVGGQLLEVAARRGKPLEEWRHDEVGSALDGLTPPVPSLPVFRTPNAAGSLITTAADYARFLSVVVGEAPGPLRDDLRLEMFRRQIEIKPPALGWGLGWGLERSGSRGWAWHWGDNPGSKNFVLADLGDRTALVVFTNGDGGRAIYERVVRAAGQDPAAFLWI